MKLIQGDCIEVMKTLEENSVDTVITDPPYGLEFMGKQWDAFTDNEAFQEWTRQWALQAYRIAKPGAIMLCFGGTRTFHRIACGIEDAGWEIRDTMMWIYGSGFPKSHNISKAIDKRAGAEREVITKARRSQLASEWWDRPWKHEQMKESGTTIGEYDITAPATDSAKLWDGWGTALKPAFEPIIVCMKPRDGTFAENALKWGVAGLNIDGGRVHNKDVSEERTRHGGGKKWEGLNYNPDRKNVQPAGRFPANIIHDGSEEVQAGFPNGSDRYFYCAKASKAERNAGEIVNRHPTVKPLSLMEYLCKLSATPTGGLVLDPFMGSGTTGMACKKTGREFIGIELDEHYFEIAEKRIASVKQVELI